MSESLRQLEHDWYRGFIPPNIAIGRDAYIDSSYAFAAYRSQRQPGLVLGDASGVYDRATFVVGPDGIVEIGEYTCLNGTYLICSNRISIGAFCLLSWGVVITDTIQGFDWSVAQRRGVLSAVADDSLRWISSSLAPQAVTLEDNVWVGFDAVVLPGVRLARGCIVGCKTVVDRDVPPYTVVAGNPARVVRRLEPTDTPETRGAAMREYQRRGP